jgi:hypothetical protein
MFIMALIIILAALGFGARRRGIVDGWREAGLFAAVITGGFAVALVEALGLARALTPSVIIAAWSVAAVGVLVWAFRQKPLVAASLEKQIRFPPFSWTVILLLAGSVLLAGIALIAALIAPPNTWDSMTYHVPRVMHWLQERSVAFFPTGIIRQNWHLPGAEYLLLNVYALAGSDRFLNLLQWGAWLGGAVGASLVTSYLIVVPLPLPRAESRRKKKGVASALVPFDLRPVLAALFALTVPMAVLQATSTQTDLVVSFWTMGAVAFMFRAQKSGHWRDVILAGMSAGIAFLTKGTAFVLLPFFVWLAWRLFQSQGFRGLLKPLAIVLLLLVFMTGWGTRYLEARRNGTLGDVAAIMTLKDYSWPCLVSNAAKQMTSECAVPFRPLMQWCAKGITGLHQAIGMKIDDERTTTGPVEHMLVPNHVFHEDYAGNFVHMVMIIACCLIALFIRAPGVRPYAVGVIAAAALFVVMVRWQPWINRMHVPMFFLGAPLVALVFPRDRWVVGGLAIGLLVLASYPLALNMSRPLVGQSNIFNVPRDIQYFWNRPDLIQPYRVLSGAILQDGCRDVGLAIGADSWEYPLWALTTRQGVAFRHMAMAGDQIKTAGTAPCLYAVVGAEAQDPLHYGKDTVFRRTASFGLYSIYKP